MELKVKELIKEKGKGYLYIISRKENSMLSLPFSGKIVEVKKQKYRINDVFGLIQNNEYQDLVKLKLARL